MPAHRLPAFLAPIVTLLVAAGMVAAAPHRDVAALAAAPLQIATVEAAFGSLREKPIQAQLVTAELSVSTRTTQDRATWWMRSGCRPACRDGLAQATAVPASHPGERTRASSLDAIASSRRAAFAGRSSSPATAPPTRSL